MAELLTVPEVAAGATDVVLTEWLVPAGSAVRAGDAIAVVETDKANVEVEAEQDAVLLGTLVEAGARADVGSPLALFGTEAERDQDVDELLQRLGVAVAGSAASVPEAAELPAKDLAASATTVPATSAAESTDPAAAAASGPAAVAELGAAADARPGGRLFISPLARRMLADAGLDARTVTGTGPNGRICRRDVEQAVKAAAVPMPAAAAASTAPVSTPAVSTDAAATPAAPAARPSAPATPAGTAVPHSRLRKAIAARLTQSKQQVPHFYLTRTVEVDELLALRAQLNEVATTKVSVNDLLVRAMAVGYVAVPEANVVWTDDALVTHDTVELAVAIASPRGLVTPVLRGVESMTPSAISARVKAFVAQAADGTLRQHDLEGGVATISNLGMYGIDDFAAIINPPQSLILAVGAARPTPVVRDGAVVAATTLTLTLSADHRAIDGALAAQWLAQVVTALEQPLRLLT